jgi:hypothetical protein
VSLNDDMLGLTRMSGRRHREEGSRNKSNKSKEEK